MPPSECAGEEEVAQRLKDAVFAQGDVIGGGAGAGGEVDGGVAAVRVRPVEPGGEAQDAAGAGGGEDGEAVPGLLLGSVAITDVCGEAGGLQCAAGGLQLGKDDVAQEFCGKALAAAGGFFFLRLGGGGSGGFFAGRALGFSNDFGVVHGWW